MARSAYGGSYDFPNVDFDWLGQLPALHEEGRQRAVRRSLEDLDPNSPSFLDQAAKRLAAGGLTDEAARLYGAATARQAANQRGATDQWYLQNYPALIESLRPKGAPGGTPGGPAEPAATYSPPSIAPAWPSGPGAPATFGPQSAAPSLGPQVAQLAPPSPPPQGVTLEGEPVGRQPVGGVRGQINIPDRLPPAATQIGAAPEALPPPTQVAGPPMVQSPLEPPPAPPPTPPIAPPAGLPPSVLPGFDPRFGALPQAPAAAAPPRPQGPFPVRAPEDTSAADRAYMDAVRVAASPGAPPGLAAMARLRFQNELEKTKKYSQDEIKYATDQLHRQMLGMPQITRQEFDRGNKIFEKVYEEAAKFNEGIQDRGKSSQEVVQTMTALQSIFNNRDYVSGPGAATIGKVQGFLRTLSDQARLWGVPDNLIPKTGDINTDDTRRLQEMSEALVNRTVLSMLSNKVGAGTSNRDVSFVTGILGDLSTSVEGRKDIAEFVKATAQNEVTLANKLRAYIHTVGRTNVDPDTMRDIAQRFSEENSVIYNRDGSLTPLGERLQGSIQLGGGRTPAQAFRESDAAAAGQAASRFVGTPIREAATAGRVEEGVPVPALPYGPRLPNENAGAIDVTGPINRGLSALGGLFGANRDTAKYFQPPMPAPPPVDTAQPAPAEPTAAVARPTGPIRYKNKEGKRGLLLPNGLFIQLED